MKRIFLMIILSVAILVTASGCQKTNKKPNSQSQKPNIKTPAEKPATTISGVGIYKSNCLSCHGMNGQGGSKGPAINTAEYKDPKKVMAVVRNGKGSMPSYKSKLTSAQITAVSNYVATLKK